MGKIHEIDSKEAEIVDGNDKGEHAGNIIRINKDSHAFAGRWFVCETSTKDSAQGFEERGVGYWNDDRRVGNVFAKTDSVEILSEIPNTTSWKRWHLSTAKRVR